MSGSPVVTMRRLQAAVKSAGGQDITSLDLARGLLEQMGATGSLRIDRTSLKVHHDRLLNWRIADQLIMTSPLNASPESSSRLSNEVLAGLYSVYVERAEEAKLIPMAFATFRLRAYAAPSPDPSRSRRRFHRVL